MCVYVWGLLEKVFKVSDKWVCVCLFQRGGALINTAVTKVRSSAKLLNRQPHQCFVQRCTYIKLNPQVFKKEKRKKNSTEADPAWHSAGFSFRENEPSYWNIWKLTQKCVRCNWLWSEWRHCAWQVGVWWAVACRSVLYNRWSGCPFMLSPPVSARGSLIQPFVSVFLPQGSKHFLMLHETRSEC